MSRHLLPSTATPMERTVSDTSARILDVDVDTIRRQRLPHECTAAFLPPLAWERSVHFWRSGDEAGNRARVASSFADHLAYGTPDALEAEVSLDVGAPVTIREFWQAPGLVWPEFLVEISAEADVVQPEAAAVWRSALRRKNVRDWPVVRFVARREAHLRVSAFLRLVASVRVRPADPTIRLRERLVAGAATTIFATIRVRPFQ